MSSGGGRRGLWLAMASALLAVTAIDVLTLGLSSTQPPPPVSAQRSAVTPRGEIRPPPSPATPSLGRGVPISLSIAAIGVRAPRLARVGRAPDGTLEVPSRFDQPGWYDLGPAPGQTGAAVIVGHVDSVSGPAVFWRLGQLRSGDQITIRREDGQTLTFTVYAVERYPKNDFPTARVYGGTQHRAELRVITCGGSFDHDTGHYLDNTVAFAALTRVR